MEREISLCRGHDKLGWRLGPKVPWVTHSAQKTVTYSSKNVSPFSCVALNI